MNIYLIIFIVCVHYHFANGFPIPFRHRLSNTWRNEHVQKEHVLQKELLTEEIIDTYEYLKPKTKQTKKKEPKQRIVEPIIAWAS